jgi:hypothetical protein
MSDLIQSLIASGIEPPAAVRISKAIISLLPTTEDVASKAVKSVSKSLAALQAPAPAPVQPPPADAPTTFTGSIETQQSAVFAGDSQFSGGITIDGDVNWKGINIEPATVQGVGGLAVSGGNLQFIPSQMAVLNDYGPGKAQRIVFGSSPGSTGDFLTKATLSTTPGNLTLPSGYTFTPTTSSFTIPTGFSFDPASCSISASGTATVTYLTGGAITQSGTTKVSFLSGASISTEAAAAWTGASAAVSALSIEDPA